MNGTSFKMDDVHEGNIVHQSNTTPRIVVGLIAACFIFTILVVARIAYQPPDSHQSDVVHLDDQTFEEQTASGIVLVDFYFDGCMPCQIMAPAVENVATRFKDKAIVVKVNSDNSNQTVDKFRVMVFPTLVLLKDGREISRLEGLQEESKLASLLETALATASGP